MRRGQPRRISFQGDPGGARRRPLLRYLGAGLGDPLRGRALAEGLPQRALYTSRISGEGCNARTFVLDG